MIRNRFIIGFGAILVLAAFLITFAEDIEDGFMHEHRYRSYILHIPPQYSGEDSLPLVINLHGGGGTAQQQMILSRMNPKADTEGFFAVYPNGTLLPVGYTGWNAGERFQSDVDDLGFLNALIDTIRMEYNVDTLRIFATGFSNGASMCYSLACEIAHRIAAIGPVAGWLVYDNWDDCQRQRLMPTIHFHSRNDPTGSYAVMDSMMAFWSESNGCDIGPDSFYNDMGSLRQIWSRADDSSEVVFWTTNAYEHGWSYDEVNTNSEMWEFFSAHPLPVPEDEPGIEARVPDFLLDSDNPALFSQRVEIHFSLGKTERVSLELFDASGRLLAGLVDSVLPEGDHRVVLDASSLSRGVYFYQLTTPTSSVTNRLILMK